MLAMRNGVLAVEQDLEGHKAVEQDLEGLFICQTGPNNGP